MEKQWKLDLTRGDFMQFEKDCKKEREIERLESQEREIEQRNAQIKEEMDRLQEQLELNGLKLWDLRLKLKGKEE